VAKRLRLRRSDRDRQARDTTAASPFSDPRMTTAAAAKALITFRLRPRCRPCASPLVCRQRRKRLALLLQSLSSYQTPGLQFIRPHRSATQVFLDHESSRIIISALMTVIASEVTRSA